MSFGNYLQEVKCLSRRQRVLNLANQLDAQFNGNKENIVEFLGSQGSNYQLAAELIDYFTGNGSESSKFQPSQFVDFETMASPLFGQTANTTKSTKSHRAFSSIYSQSQRPTPLRSNTTESRSNSAMKCSNGPSSIASTVAKNQNNYRNYTSMRTPLKSKTEQKNRMNTGSTSRSEWCGSGLKQSQLNQFQQILNQIQSNQIHLAITGLQDLDKQHIEDLEIRTQVIGALYQCSHIQRDKSACERYSDRFLELLKSSTHCEINSTLQIDMLIFQLNKQIKQEFTLIQPEDIEYIIREISRTSIQFSYKQKAKVLLLQLRYHMAIGKFYQSEVAQLMMIGQDDAKVQRELFGKIGRMIYDLQTKGRGPSLFEEMFFFLQQQSESNLEILQNQMLFYVFHYIDNAKKNLNSKYFKVASNLFIQWASRMQITHTVKTAIQITEIIVFTLFDKHASFGTDEQDIIIQSVLRILSHHLPKTELVKQTIFNLSLAAGKFYHTFDSYTRALELLELSYNHESYESNKEGVLLKFKLLQNILNIGLKSQNFDHLHYIYEIDKVINAQILSALDKAILCNEIANSLLKGKLYRSAQSYYQKALHLVPSTHAIVSRISNNLRICQHKIQ